MIYRHGDGKTLNNFRIFHGYKKLQISWHPMVAFTKQKINLHFAWRPIADQILTGVM
jgi:hypothetical protein